MTSAFVVGAGVMGWSFYEWREKQDKQYVERLQYLVDRKERRDAWDKAYLAKLGEQ